MPDLHSCSLILAIFLPWTKIHVIVSLDQSLTWTKVSLDICLLGLMSPWTNVSLDNCPLDNCSLDEYILGQLSLGQCCNTANDALEEMEIDVEDETTKLSRWRDEKIIEKRNLIEKQEEIDKKRTLNILEDEKKRKRQMSVEKKKKKKKIAKRENFKKNTEKKR